MSLTAKDFRWEYYRGSGKGGQARNKTDNCCRCTHPPSGVTAYSEDGRSKEHNKQEAFRKVTENPMFKLWLKMESWKRTGELKKIEDKIAHEIKYNTQVDIKDENGRWKKAGPEDFKSSDPEEPKES